MSVRAEDSAVFHRFLDHAYPEVERGDGVWLTTTDGRRILDGCSGGAMVTCLGHGVPDVVAAAEEQGSRLAYFYNHHVTNEPAERLAERLLETVAPDMARVRFVSGGSEANESALQLARLYHVERGEPDRWRILSSAQSYHGSTMGTLALSGRGQIREPYAPYLAEHLHLAPERTDPSGASALRELDRLLEDAGPGTVAAFLCEPVSGAALPAWRFPDAFWEGLAERRDAFGFLLWFDEVVTGVGRTGTWLAAHQLPIEPDIVTIGKSLGAGYAPLGAVLCRQHVYDALDQGSGEFDLGHTWDGAPLPSAVGLAVLDQIEARGLVDRVRTRGPALGEQLRAALEGIPFVGEVRDAGYLLGIELVDPRGEGSFLPVGLDAASLVEAAALALDLLVMGVHPQVDGFAGDQIVLAPAYVASDEELTEMVDRIAAAIRSVEPVIDGALGGGGAR